MERLRKIGFSRLTPLEEALDKLFSIIKLNDLEEIETVLALNRILATNIKSNMDVPPFNRAAMDGYAIKAEDSFGASPKNPNKIKKIDIIEIGEVKDLKLNKGECIRISTGAAIPEGCDAVIKIEDTEIEKEVVTLYTSLAPGKNISKKGEDIPIDTEVLKEGEELSAEHIALLTSLGIKNIEVRSKPKVSVFAVGDELLEVGQPLQKNKIFNSNTPMISNLIKIYGGEIVRESILKDNKEQLKESLMRATVDSQIIIFTGGTSVGTKDFLPEVMHESGEVLTHGIAMRPGAPILIGYVNEVLTFCLPGTPVAAYIGFITIIGLSLRKMLGCSILDPRIEINASISKDVPVSSLGYINHLRVKIEKNKNEYNAIPIKLKGSGVISSLTQSDGIIEIPPFQEGLKKGEKVIIKIFPK